MKKFIKDMDQKEIEKCLQVNERFYNLVYNDLYEQDMDWQYEEGKLLFGENSHKYIEIRDHYSSFYLVLINWYEFIENLDPSYLCSKGIDLYNEIIKLKKEYENIACDTEEEENRYNELEEELENKCKDLLEICEDQLHEYEKGDYSTEDLIDYVMNSSSYEDFYITGENYILYSDHTTCYK